RGEWVEGSARMAELLDLPVAPLSDGAPAGRLSPAAGASSQNCWRSGLAVLRGLVPELVASLVILGSILYVQGSPGALRFFLTPIWLFQIHFRASGYL